MRDREDRCRWRAEPPMNGESEPIFFTWMWRRDRLKSSLQFSPSLGGTKINEKIYVIMKHFILTSHKSFRIVLLALQTRKKIAVDIIPKNVYDFSENFQRISNNALCLHTYLFRERTSNIAEWFQLFRSSRKITRIQHKMIFDFFLPYSTQKISFRFGFLLATLNSRSISCTRLFTQNSRK